MVLKILKKTQEKKSHGKWKIVKACHNQVMASLNSSATELCAQEPVQTNVNENIKILIGGSPLQRTGNVESVSMPWRHHDYTRAPFY